jgi:hypothetical protein
MVRPERFFTWWAIACHLLYIFGVLPSTWILAVIVWTYSMYHNVTINRQHYHMVTDVILHHMPVILFVAAFACGTSTPQWSYSLFLGIAALYLLVNQGPANVWTYYNNVPFYFNDLRTSRPQEDGCTTACSL